MAARPLRCVVLAGVLVAWLAAPAWATVSILAVDPTTGEVGVAGASCAQFDLARIATVLPGVGVAVSQGHTQIRDPERLLTALRQTARSSDALDRVASPAPGTQARQFGAVMLGGGTASFTDPGAGPVAAETATDSVLALGTSLRSRDAVDRAKDAFLQAPGDLAHRLIAGLRAAGAEGGDRRCHSQTATAAFIIVAGRGQDPVVPIRGLPGVARRQRKEMHMIGRTVAADQLGDLLRDAAGLRRPAGPGRPDLYLSLIQPAHGFNAIKLLAQAYRQILASPTPTPTPSVPPTVTPAPATPSVSATEDHGGGGHAFLWLLLGAGAVVALAGLRWWSRRRAVSSGPTTTKR